MHGHLGQVFLNRSILLHELQGQESGLSLGSIIWSLWLGLRVGGGSCFRLSDSVERELFRIRSTTGATKFGQNMNLQRRKRH